MRILWPSNDCVPRSQLFLNTEVTIHAKLRRSVFRGEGPWEHLLGQLEKWHRTWAEGEESIEMVSCLVLDADISRN